MKKIVIFILASLFIISSCSEKEEMAKQEKEKLVIGIDPTFPPFEIISSDSSTVEGFDISIMNEISRINNWDIEYEYTRLSNILSELNQKKFDIVISALSITPEREVEVSFSKPYFRTGQIITIPKEDSSVISLSDLVGKRVGVQSGSTGQRLVKKIDGIQVFSYPNILEAFNELRLGELEAVINDFSNTIEYIQQDSTLRTVGGFLTNEYYAIATRQNDPELLGNINFALDSLVRSSFYKKEYKNWFGVNPERLPTDSNFITVDSTEE